jgi:hypothetical protein
MLSYRELQKYMKDNDLHPKDRKKETLESLYYRHASAPLPNLSEEVLNRLSYKQLQAINRRYKLKAGNLNRSDLQRFILDWYHNTPVDPNISTNDLVKKARAKKITAYDREQILSRIR